MKWLTTKNIFKFRWDHLNKGGVKVIGLLEDAVAAMTWLQHQCDSSLEIIVPKGERFAYFHVLI